MYFFSGCGLAIFVAVASSRVKDVDHIPIQELFKSRSGAMLLLAMAVLVAPLVEETVFRGYLYPLFASKFSGLAKKLAPIRFAPSASAPSQESSSPESCSASCTARSSAGPGASSACSLSSELFLPSPVLGPAPCSRVSFFTSAIIS